MRHGGPIGTEADGSVASLASVRLVLEIQPTPPGVPASTPHELPAVHSNRLAHICAIGVRERGPRRSQFTARSGTVCSGTACRSRVVSVSSASLSNWSGTSDGYWPLKHAVHSRSSPCPVATTVPSSER